MFKGSEGQKGNVMKRMCREIASPKWSRRQRATMELLHHARILKLRNAQQEPKATD
jgi:hypothetical protein